MYIELQTNRLKLRPIDKTDSKFIFELVNSEGWLRFIGNRNVRNEQDAINYIQKVIDEPRFFYHVFELKETQQPIGILTFLYREEEKFPDIGFALLPQFENKGYTFEAAKSYIEHLLDTKKRNQIIAICQPENSKSINLIKKLGLTFESDYKKGEETISYFSLKL